MFCRNLCLWSQSQSTRLLIVQTVLPCMLPAPGMKLEIQKTIVCIYFLQVILPSRFMLLLLEAMKMCTTRRAVLPVPLHLQCARSAATLIASVVAASGTEAALAVAVVGKGMMTAESRAWP